MNIRVLFGYLFFGLSLLFAGYQFAYFAAVEQTDELRMLLLFVVTLLCLTGGFMSFETHRPSATSALAGIAFLAAALGVVAIAAFVMMGAANLSLAKYAVLFAYACFYGLFGLAYSLLARRNTPTEE
ncbi:MAG: hypothetical protein AB1813_19440 [Verrucomicrobiota bacterium]|jgi:hypothetical protein